jgi:hypothetical protein
MQGMSEMIVLSEGVSASARLQELDSVITGDGFPLAHAAGPAEARRARGFRLWSATHAPLSSFDSWLEIRARSNFRSVEEEREGVKSIRARAPAVITKVRDFRMFSGEDGEGVPLGEIRKFLELGKKDRKKADVWSRKVHIHGNSWNAAALLPKTAVERVMEEQKSAKKCSDPSAHGLLDALHECSSCLPAFALHKESRAWELLKEDGVGRLKEYVRSLEPLIDCSRRAKELLDELDEVERYVPFASRVCPERCFYLH